MSDERLRDLELRAAKGDLQAQETLLAIRRRYQESLLESTIGQRIDLTDRHGGFTLLTERGNTLWRRGHKTGVVVGVEPGRFYQNQEHVAWLEVLLDKAHGRYHYARAYLDEVTGELLHGACWI